MLIAVLSWIIVFCCIFYFAGIMTVPFINDALIPYVIIISVGIGVLSAIILLFLLIKERIKDKREEDKDDLSKY